VIEAVAKVKLREARRQQSDGQWLIEIKAKTKLREARREHSDG
jgi:hypothetical protein